jgi:ketosteroid isomerase-like protein
MRLLFAFSFVALRLAAQSTPQQAAEKEVLALEQQYNSAYAANDLPKYFSFLADDFSQFLPSGRTDKASYVKSWTRFLERGGKVMLAEFSDMKIQVNPTGDAAVASYLLHVKTQSARGLADDFYQESDVLFKRGGEWKVVHLNYAPAPKKKEQPAQ